MYSHKPSKIICILYKILVKPLILKLYIMQITVNIPDLQQALLVLQMLRAVPQATVEVSEPVNPSAKREVSSLFGAIKNKMSLEEIEQRLQQQKQEWL